MPTSGTAKDGQSIFYGWIVLGVAFITVVLGYAIRNTFAVFYPNQITQPHPPQCLENSHEPVKMVLSLISNLVEDEYGRAY
jgi:hypothetical protein